MMKRMSLGCLLAFAVLAAVLAAAPGKALALDQNECLTCHANPDLFKTDENGNKISLYVSPEEVDKSAHRFIDCTTCHTANPHQVNTPLNKLSLAEKCGTCHAYQYDLYKDSIHGKVVTSGNQEAASCVDCHSDDSNPHSVIRVLEASAPTYKKNIAQTCAKCHDNQALMANYGIVEKVYETYMTSFHGKALELSSYAVSQLDKATCTNCHGAHDIQAVNDPNAPVASLQNLAKTCDQIGCHPGADVQFAAGFLGHREASPQNIPVAHYTEVVFAILLYGVVGFGAIVVILALIRYALNRWRNVP
jgi:nitrate/TMAO reductase-like tetraheme cytochrome c subunit